MKLSISNIGWSKENDEKIYLCMKKHGFSGIEIAPTRIFEENPYDKEIEAKNWAKEIKTQYGLEIPSMQSIWYGKQEKLFGEDAERKILFQYTKKAVDFAALIGCKNLVFGCPKNRNKTNDSDENVAVDFFRRIGDYANKFGMAIGIEANPIIYNTNYINDTLSALELIKKVNSKGFLLNLDVGTIIYNNESISELIGKVKYINHVHISEPNLKPIEERKIHKELKKILENENYSGYISIEQGKSDDFRMIEKNMEYIKKTFGD